MDHDARRTMIADALRNAREARRRVRIRGAGTWLGAGFPVDADVTVSTNEDRGIVEYVPGDLTLTARAGTRLSEIAAATSAQGQWLPLDPWGGDDGTIGATVSTASTGPYAYAMGTPRDQVLGLELVTGDGRVLRAGGRVVKNVAGFDLTRLFTGAWGTLGVITEVTVRLRARPPRTRTLAIRIPDVAAVDALPAQLRALPFTPLAAELLHGALAARLGLPAKGAAMLLVRLGANERSLMAQADLLRGFGECADAPDACWDTLRTSQPAATSCWRWSSAPAGFGAAWRAMEQLSRGRSDVLAHGSPARGIVRVVAAGTTGDAAAARAFDGTVIVETLAPDAWRDVPPLAADPLSRAIRRKFDPSGILNPGILGPVA